MALHFLIVFIANDQFNINASLIMAWVILNELRGICRMIILCVNNVMYLVSIFDSEEPMAQRSAHLGNHAVTSGPVTRKK